eukprot:SAG11_NODE_2054_length_3878_cov_1.867161_3_plen_282_part_00
MYRSHMVHSISATRGTATAHAALLVVIIIHLLTEKRALVDRSTMHRYRAIAFTIESLPVRPSQPRVLSRHASQQRALHAPCAQFPRIRSSTAVVRSRRVMATKTSPADSTKGKDTEDVLDTASGKSGTPSPWTASEVWDVEGGPAVKSSASATEVPKALNEADVTIPFTDGERDALPSETKILSDYDNILSQRSHRHFGYPYNLQYDHEELFPFMQYSINNLGDPFIPSNYGVHSREFEVAVIDFFAQLWKIDKPDYWGYVTTCGTEGNLHGAPTHSTSFL